MPRLPVTLTAGWVLIFWLVESVRALTLWARRDLWAELSLPWIVPFSISVALALILFVSMITIGLRWRWGAVLGAVASGVSLIAPFLYRPDSVVAFQIFFTTFLFIITALFAWRAHITLNTIQEKA